MSRRLFLVCMAACGSAAPPPPAKTETVAVVPESERRAKLAALHREKLDAQATALAATCDKPLATVAATRCAPTCYAVEPADALAGKKPPRSAEITHVVCTRDSGTKGPYMITDELGATMRPAKRTPRAAKKGSWQADVELAVRDALGGKPTVRVTGAWTARTHPVTGEALRCTTVAQFTRGARASDACGGSGSTACEARGNVAAHALNLLHFRLADARRLASNAESCQRSALDAIAIARGMPRWRQYMTLNTSQWKSYPRYRTRFDGLLDEDTLFAVAADLGAQAEQQYVTCGGAAAPVTTVTQEQAFHTCD